MIKTDKESLSFVLAKESWDFFKNYKDSSYSDLLTLSEAKVIEICKKFPEAKRETVASFFVCYVHLVSELRED